MRLGFFLFFISLPFFAALGFDYFEYQLEPSKGFNLNQLGTIWAQNFRESYVSVKQSASPDTWEIILVFLKQPAALLAFLFAHITYIAIALIKITGWFLSWSREVSAEERQKYKTQDVKDLDFLKKNQKDDYKYKYKYKK